MKNFLFFLFLPIACVLIIVFGPSVLGYILFGLLALYIHDRFFSKKEIEVEIKPFLPHKKSRLKLGGYLYYYQPSLVKEFDEYFLSRLNIDPRKVFIAKKNPEFEGHNIDPYFEELTNHLKWEFRPSLRKFKFTQVKLNNTILKVNEFERRLQAGKIVKKRSELNLSDSKDGFGHIQENRDGSIEKFKMSLAQRVVFTAFSLIIICLMLTIIYYYR